MSTDRKLARKDRGTWIPKKYFDDHSLTLAEVISLSEIASLDGEEGCFAMNKHFANRLRVSRDRAGKIIGELEKKGRIERVIIPSSKGRRRYLSVVGIAESHTVKIPDGHPAALPQPSGENTGGDPLKIPDAILEENTRERTKEEATTPPLPDFLDSKTKKGKIYLAAKAGYLLAWAGFYEWFENQVLKRFPKFSVASVNDTILRDYDTLVFSAYGNEIANAAVVALMEKTKGQVPNPAEVKKEARKIKRISDADKPAAAARVRQLEEKAADRPIRDTIANWSDDALQRKLENYKKCGELFNAARCEREIARRKTAGKKEEVACL